MTRLKQILLCTAIIIVFWAASGFVIGTQLDCWADRGAFGDMFGAINALFSGLALAGVIYAILLQHEELGLQRRELELTREELNRTANAYERTQSLSSVRFALDLTPSFLESRDKYNSVWNATHKYHNVPTSLTHDDWEELCDALRKCYEVCVFLYQIAQLNSRNVLPTDVLYTLHYEHIMEHTGSKFSQLVKWCGTGVDLAANFNVHEVLRLLPPVISLLERLEQEHLSAGGQAYEHQLKQLRTLLENTSQNIRGYECGPESINPYVSIRDYSEGEP